MDGSLSQDSTPLDEPSTPPPDLTLQLPGTFTTRSSTRSAERSRNRSLLRPTPRLPRQHGHRRGRLLLTNVEEEALAAQFVAANVRAMDCLRLAQEHAADVPRVPRCTTQSASMLRQARGARSLLLRVQTARQKRVVGWIEHCAIGLMTEALRRALAAPTGKPEPAPVPTPAPETDDPFVLPTGPSSTRSSTRAVRR